MTDQQLNSPLSLAEKINKLFEIVRKPDGSKYSNPEVSELIKKSTGETLSQSYLWQLRMGHRTNPTMRHLEAIADFFDIPPAYFFDDAKGIEIAAEMDLVWALRNSGVRQVALRAVNLSEKSLATVQEMIDIISNLEKKDRTGKS